ncbi:MAG: PD40 domain-containing protein [Cyclobacteriaceae bacterium]|nr:PD40 domain-containing protein [Cyclobacteriaceae bacterium]
MKIKSRTIERVHNAAMISILYVATGLYSCIANAQSLTAAMTSDVMHPVSFAANANKKINHHVRANKDAKATPLHTSINGPYAELKPAVAPGGNRIYFSRADHPDNSFGTIDFEDIWYADHDTATGTWLDPVRMSGHLNNAGPNFIHSVSQTGDTIILGNEYLKNGKMRDGLSYSVNVNGQWSLPKTIKVQNHYNMDDQANAYVSLKNGIIIMAISRVESVGDRDLYVSFWDGEKATEPINMGTTVNTEMEESSPYLAADNKTLYFASKGHNGFGGLDIFVTRRLDDTWTNWSEPENLGPAVNGAMDEEFFNITHCGKRAVFSRQVTVHNFDLFTIHMEDLFGSSEPSQTKSSDTAVAMFR